MPGPWSLDGDHGLVVAALDGELDRRALGVLERVADQVAEHLQHAIAIGRHDDLLLGDVRDDLAAGLL